MSNARAFALAAGVAIAAGLAIRSQALDAGFWADDYLHYAMLHGAYPVARAPWDLFRFASGGADTERLVEYGYYPWWAHDEFKLSMLRPLASLSHALDYELFSTDARAHHIHSALWWVLCALSAGALLFAALPRAAAAIALVLFALDESHVIPLLWISNRSALMATSFACAGLFGYLRYRRDHARFGLPLSLSMFALALASGEYTFTALGYLLSLELFVGTGSPAARLRALSPFLGLIAAFLAVWVLGGYGSAHSGLYTSPLGDPLAYAQKVLSGVPVLTADLIWAIPADHYSFGPPSESFLRSFAPGGPDSRTFQIVAGALGLWALYGLLRAVERRSSTAERAVLRAFALGAVLGLLPALGSFVTTRLLVPPALGVAALLASAAAASISTLREVVRSPPGSSREGSARAAALALSALGAIGSLHVYRAVDSGLAATRKYTRTAQARTRWPLAAPLAPSRAGELEVVMPAAADANDAAYFPFVRFLHGHPMVRGFRLLSGAPGPHAITRTDEHTLELTVLDPRALPGSIVGSLTRAQTDPLAAGARLARPDVEARVLASKHGQPVKLEFTFDRSLDDPSLLFVYPTASGVHAIATPKVGDSVTLPPPRLPELAP